MKQNGHLIQSILPGSIAEELQLEKGDVLVKINGEELEDIFDYQFLTQTEELEILIRKENGEEWILEIEKEEDEDLGIQFENGLMDDYKSCHNKCIFCFIDQMPKGMRETLYFKDDDSRLSFLQGNYVTLTNMSESDIGRIIKYRLSPINISFHTTNPELRCQMLNNRFAGEALNKVTRFYEAGIHMNGQIVLCKGVNDGLELERSIRDLTAYLPYLESVSIVPVGISKYRDGLYKMEPFEKEDALQVLEMVHKWQERLFEEQGIHFIHASDEWYLLAGRELPDATRYDGYLQLENGVGMLRLLRDEFEEELSFRKESIRKNGKVDGKKIEISMATGRLAYETIKQMADQLMCLVPDIMIQVYPIRNNFFGENITVSGLLTGGDLAAQLKGKKLGSRLLLPANVLRSGEDIFLDDMTLEGLEKALQVKIDIVKSSGQEFIAAVLD